MNFTSIIFALTIASLTLTHCGKRSKSPSSDMDSVGGVFQPKSTDRNSRLPMMTAWGVTEGGNTLYSAANCRVLDIDTDTGVCRKPVRIAAQSLARNELKELVFSTLENMNFDDDHSSNELAAHVRNFLGSRAWSTQKKLDLEMPPLKASMEKIKLILPESVLLDPRFAKDQGVIEYAKISENLKRLEAELVQIHASIIALEGEFNSFLEKVEKKEMETQVIESPFANETTLFLTVLNKMGTVKMGAEAGLSSCEGHGFNDGFAWVKCHEKYLMIDYVGTSIFTTDRPVRWVRPFGDGVFSLAYRDPHEVLVVDSQGQIIARNKEILDLGRFSHGTAAGKTSGQYRSELYDHQLMLVKGLESDDGIKSISEADEFGMRVVKSSNSPIKSKTWYQYYLTPQLKAIHLPNRISELGKFFDGHSLFTTMSSDEISMVDLQGSITTFKVPPAQMFKEFKIPRIYVYEDFLGIYSANSSGYIIFRPKDRLEIDVKGDWYIYELSKCHNGWYRYYRDIDLTKLVLAQPDTLDELVIAPELSPKRCFSKEGLAIAVNKNGLFSYIGTDGQIAWKNQHGFTKAEEFSDGLAFVERQDGKRGYISASGEFAIEF